MNRVTPLTIVFCIPGTSFSHHFLGSWSELLLSLPKNNIIPKLSNRQSSNVYYARNLCLGGSVLKGSDQSPFGGQQNYDYIMWIDSDVVFRSEQFYHLLNQDKDIISGYYMTENNKNFPVVEDWDQEYFRKNGKFHFLTEEEIGEKEGCFPVVYNGLGFMLIKKGVFEKIGYPWFRPISFEFEDGIKDFCSEDVGFCHTAREKGFTVWVDPSIRVGHVKSRVL